MRLPVAVIAALLLCSTAQAETASGREPLVSADQYVRFGETFWPGSPCAGREVIDWVPTFEDARLGEARLDCHIAVKTGQDIYRTCTVVVHELGHVAGYRDDSNVAHPEHSSDPTSVMASHFAPFPPCLQRFGAQIAEGAIYGSRCTYAGRRRTFACRTPRALWRVVLGENGGSAATRPGVAVRAERRSAFA